MPDYRLRIEAEY
jgi:hypothetical protein